MDDAACKAGNILRMNGVYYYIDNIKDDAVGLVGLLWPESAWISKHLIGLKDSPYYDAEIFSPEVWLEIKSAILAEQEHKTPSYNI